MQELSRTWRTAIVVTLLFCFVATTGCMNVSYDNRALLIDGKRRFLQSGAIHYPRSTPEMWPGLINLAKEGGLDLIETYVFWSVHEPEQGMSVFEGNGDLARFVKDVADAGLFVLLRIGPYVCAEWNFGGFPAWLRFLPGIELRTNNEVYKAEMGRFVKKIVNLMKDEQLFASQGGPIVLAQIENEYGNIDSAYGDPGKAYMRWAADFANGLETGVPWIMCNQWDAPENVINTCNGYYCDSFVPNNPTKPKFWTENWAGWYQNWGKQVPRRPVEDIAFAVARFFERGGSMQNYYMYHGGTNFGRTSGEWITTTYDYDAPIDEFGQPRQPKWGHLKELHAAIKMSEPALGAVDGTPFRTSLGFNLEAHIYADSNGSTVEEIVRRSTKCAAFLANISPSLNNNSVSFNGNSYDLPAWSVSILPDCKSVVFNTAKVRTQTSVMIMVPAVESNILPQSQDGTGTRSGDQISLEWEAYSEPPPGTWGETSSFSGGLLEQLNGTKDSSDYLWYMTSVQKPSIANWAMIMQALTDTAVQVFVNGEYIGIPILAFETEFTTALNLTEENNSIAILSSTVGLQNYGAWLERVVSGLKTVWLAGSDNNSFDLTNEEWQYQVGVQGESLKLFTTKGAQAVSWRQQPASHEPLVWYKAYFHAPAGSDPVALDLESMGKGQAWINGKSIGRFWTLPQASLRDPGLPCRTSCTYRGGYSPENCAGPCGGPSQRWYHVPRDWLQPFNNLLVLFEETGGDVSKVAVVTQFLDKICAHVDLPDLPDLPDLSDIPDLHSTHVMPSAASQSHISSIIISSNNLVGHTAGEKRATEQLHLACAPGSYVSEVLFGSIGNPSGECGNFRRGECHADLRSGPLHQECIGRQQCSLDASLENFAEEDPCPTLRKSLAVEVLCTATKTTIPFRDHSVG